jgi:type IV secretory pathway TraG/TraD family ATPase VirD4
VLVWSLYGVLLVATAALVGSLWWLATRAAGLARRNEGFAGRGEVARSMSLTARQREAAQLRPSLPQPRKVPPEEVAIVIGRVAGSRVSVYTGPEDSTLVHGPMGSGKTMWLTVPIAATVPGPLVCTSTKPEYVALTRTLRAQRGPVFVFDPHHIHEQVTAVRWSPVAGCTDPLVAMYRAAALVAGGVGAEGVTNAGFWESRAAVVVRCYLRAAALAGMSIRDVLRWSANPADEEPVRLLRRPGGDPVWAGRLQQAANLVTETRDGIWSQVQVCLDAFDDPRVLEACCPDPGEGFDAEQLVRERGTLYVVTSPKTMRLIAPLITALVGDVVDAARRVAREMPGGRLDPWLTLLLDECANICPLPDLPELLSTSRAEGVYTVAVFQSPSQVRQRWGEDGASTIDTNCAVKVFLGGLSDAHDLQAVSSLLGEYDQVEESVNLGRGGTSRTRAVRRRPVLAPDEIRTLPRGQALLVPRAARPVRLALTPWWRRRDLAPAMREAAQAYGSAPVPLPTWGPSTPVEAIR